MKKKLLCTLFALSMAMTGISCTENGQDQQSTQMDNPQTVESQQEPLIYHAQLPEKKEEADIFIEPIKNLPEDFIKGMDVSSVLALEDSGVVYYNEQGEPADLFRILADAGINYIRVRIWNSPYDKDGYGYGGGNCDVKKAAEIGARAAQNGMKLLVDFHYSDFWADPAKQSAPMEWAKLSLSDKEQALYDFTKESLQTILAAGADIGIVQIGNEINHGMAGEEEWERITPLLIQASKAVRKIAAENEQEIQVAVHFTDIDDHDQTVWYAKTLEDAGLDYDIFGISYYPYWHGTMEHMATVLKDIRNSFHKETLVLETSYCYTLEDGDGFSNSVGEDDLIDGYAATEQSQATCVRDIMEAASKASALGVLYWEGAWIPVGTPQQLTENEKLWETYGSGWASSYAANYDKEDAGQYYGGCAWDNQAMFDFTGHPLASLNVFKYVNYGTSCPQAVDYAKETTIEIVLGQPLQMPESVDVVYNDRSFHEPAPVIWDKTQIKKANTNKVGTYTIDGRLEDGTSIVCKVIVTDKNWLLNPGFEQNDISMWKVSYKGDLNPTEIQEKESDAISGTNSFHFWSEKKQDFQIEQTVSGLEAGTYKASVNIQGGDIEPSAKIYLYAIANGTIQKSDYVVLNGWCEWQMPTLTEIESDGKTDITIGVKVKCNAGGWGTMDDFSLIKTD